MKGEIFANIWQTDYIARIIAGHRQGDRLDRSARPAAGRPMRATTDVLNGIAYDAEHDRLFVTGKRWPKLFEITLR